MRRKPVGDWRDPAKKSLSLIGSNRFRFLNEEHDIVTPGDWNNPEWPKLWLYNLHYFQDLVAITAPERHRLHHDIITRWIAENPPGIGNGWEPYPLSLRIVNWIKWILAGNEPFPDMLHSLAVQLRYLRKMLEFHLLGNHLFANAKAMIFGGLFFSGLEAQEWLQVGSKILKEELREQILGDGGHFELSPMYHNLILEDILDLINLFHHYGLTDSEPGESLPSRLELAAVNMLFWSRQMTHPDGSIVLFNDASQGVAPEILELKNYYSRLKGMDVPGHPESASVSVQELADGKLIHFQDSGYIHIEKGPAEAFLDVACIGPDYLPAHAHADTLNFELSVFGKKLLVDTGTSTYKPDLARVYQRSTPAHNTVSLGHKDSSDMWGAFRVGRRARPFNLSVSILRDDSLIVGCSHDGYAHCSGHPVHTRQWRFGRGFLEISDFLTGTGYQAVGRFHFAPEIALLIEPSGKTGLIKGADGQDISWIVAGGSGEIENTTYHPEFGSTLENKTLKMKFDEPSAKITFRWRVI